MKQSASFFTLLAIFVSGVSLNTQAQGLPAAEFETNLEKQFARLKAEALVELQYEVKANIQASKIGYLGTVAKPEATQSILAEQAQLMFDNLVKLAD